jgi:cyanophycin synthetase
VSDEPAPDAWHADSRRLTGPNLYFAETGAVLEALGPRADDSAAHAAWRDGVAALRHALGWPEAPLVVRRHATGTQLAMAAPEDLLLTATEVNEWAWEATSGPPVLGVFDTARTALAAHAAAERDPARDALAAAARERGLPVFVDDDVLSLGAGRGSRAWPLRALPDPRALRWDDLHDVPTALVTGSNGKTTTARLIAAMVTASGRVPGVCGTEGVTVGTATIARGDYAGPAGARLVLRHPQVEAAVLETARGGILRRGLATARADVAVVTNVSADHFGEYGVDTLDDLADAKLVVARALGTDGLLVLNADDALLLARAAALRCRVALFALADAHPALAALRSAGGLTCGAADGRLRLWLAGAAHDLGAVAAMPIAHGGAAPHNVGNAAAAALTAAALGVAPQAIAAALARFGRDRADNPGRLQRWDVGGVVVLLDYAHNPEGLNALLGVAAVLRAAGGSSARLGLLLGQAGNRGDAAIAELARSAARRVPDRVVLKELPAMLRGRAPGEVPALMARALAEAGVAGERVATVADEVDAARALLAWARRGDTVVLPVHASASREELSRLLDGLRDDGWQAGALLPARGAGA